MWGCPLTYDWGMELIPSPKTRPQTEPWVWGCPITLPLVSGADPQPLNRALGVGLPHNL